MSRIWNRTLIGILAVAIIVVVVLIVSLATGPKTGETYSEFYLLGAGGQASNYPTRLTVGVAEDVTVGIVNREHETKTYSVTVEMLGTEVASVGPITLEHGERWEDALSVVAAAAAESERLEFLVFLEGVPEPYLKLHLVVSVTD